MTATILMTLFIIILNVTSEPVGTTVTLLEDESDKSTLVIKTDKGSTVLDSPYESTQLSFEQAPTAPEVMDATAVQKRFGEVLEYAPLKPAQVTLYFKSGTADLRDDSKAKLNEILEMVSVRQPAYINVIGHSDRKGSDEYNIRLSLERAEVVKKWLLDQNVEVADIFVESYGENDPVIPTPDGVAEPKNRRVELLIK